MNTLFKKTALFAIAALLAGGAVTAQAGDLTTHEVEGNTSSAFRFGSSTSESFDINVGYSYTLMEMLQASTLMGFGWQDGSPSTTSFNVLVGPTLNLALDNQGLRNAIYLRGLIGLAYAKAASSSTNFAYNVGLGKRFSCWGNLTWKPEFNMSGTTASGSDPAFAVIPLQLSFLF